METSGKQSVVHVLFPKVSLLLEDAHVLPPISQVEKEEQPALMNPSLIVSYPMMVSPISSNVLEAKEEKEPTLEDTTIPLTNIMNKDK